MNTVSVILISAILAVLSLQLYVSHGVHQSLQLSSAAQEKTASELTGLSENVVKRAELVSEDKKAADSTGAGILPLQYEGVNGSFIYFKPIVINVANPKSGSRHFLRLKIVLDVVDSAHDEVIRNIPVILDRVYIALRAEALSKFKGQAGTDMIRQTVQTAVEDRLGADKVKEVLFQEMLIQ